ncbi:unnamed protein product, partial [Prorocentrum cordatum]
GGETRTELAGADARVLEARLLGERGVDEARGPELEELRAQVARGAEEGASLRGARAASRAERRPALLLELGDQRRR